MKRTPEEIIKKYEATADEHSKFEAMYRPVFEYGMPARYSSIQTEAKGNKNREIIFSSVFEQSCDEFVQRFQSLICPVNTDWIDFEAGYMFSKDESNTDTVNKELAKIANILNVYKATSNFDTAFTEACYDLIAGTACLCVLDGTPDNPLTFSAIPFRELTMEEGVNGQIIAYYRKMHIKNRLVKSQWHNADYTFEPDKEDEYVDLLECTYLDEDANSWIYSVIKIADKKVILERAYKCSPFIDLRWSKCAGETYGRGVGLKVIADVKTLNRIVEYSLRALAFTIPTFLASTENGFNPEKFKLDPGAVVPVPSNLSSNPTVTQLQVNPMPDLEQYHADQLAMDIKRAMFASTIPNNPDPHMTATEVAQRVNELDNSLNNSFGRLLEFLYRLARRMIEVCQRFGYIGDKIDVRQFNGYGYKVKINTELANQQSRKEVSDVLQAVQVLAQFDPNMQMATKVLKMEELTPYVLDKMGVPNKFLRTADEIKVMEEEQAQAMQQAQMNQVQMDVDASNAKEIGKADAKLYEKGE